MPDVIVFLAAVLLVAVIGAFVWDKDHPTVEDSEYPY